MNPLISHNLEELYGNMFESNLLKIIQPYSNVELVHIAKLIKLPVDQVSVCIYKYNHASLTECAYY